MWVLEGKLAVPASWLGVMQHSRGSPCSSLSPAGAYPASLDDAETERILTTLLELGVNTFVCLQAEFSLHTPEAAWRSGQGLRPYIKDAQQVLIRARETGSHRIKQVWVLCGCWVPRAGLWVHSREEYGRWVLDCVAAI
jgi:hypothetical protein